MTTAGGRGVTFRYDAGPRRERHRRLGRRDPLRLGCVRPARRHHARGARDRWGYDLAGRLVEHARDGRTWRTTYAGPSRGGHRPGRGHHPLPLRPAGPVDVGPRPRTRAAAAARRPGRRRRGGRSARGITSTEYTAVDRSPHRPTSERGTELHSRRGAGRAASRPPGPWSSGDAMPAASPPTCAPTGGDTSCSTATRRAGRCSSTSRAQPHVHLRGTPGGRLASIDVDGATMRWGPRPRRGWSRRAVTPPGA